MRGALQDNEIKNGRLAMVAFLGFVAQHAATGKVGRPPLAVLCALLPTAIFCVLAAHNVLYLRHAPAVAAAVAMPGVCRGRDAGFSGGCAVQGPIDNLVDHINNPTGVTFATNGVSLPFVR